MPSHDSLTDPSSSPLRSIPAHLQPDMSDRPNSPSASSSPSDAYSKLNLSNSSTTTDDMADSQDNGDDCASASASHRQRSASPAKRSASLMEGADEIVSTHQADTTTLNGNAIAPAVDDNPPAYSEHPNPAATTTTLTIDDQISQVSTLAQAELVDGDKGFVVATKWLMKVVARGSVPFPDMDVDKTALEGEIGPIDNSDIVPPGAFQNAIKPFELDDVEYVPLLRGLSMGHEFQILPEPAWSLILSWYGLAEGQLPIARFVHNTAPPGGAVNLVYETYPPVFTIRKVTPDANRLPSPPALLAPNTTPEAASIAASVRIVASRTERFQTFLARSKSAASILIKHKVKVWRQLDPAQISVESSTSTQPGILTPATSRSSSPSANTTFRSPQHLVIPPRVFGRQWEEGTDYEEIDIKDETNNDNYNGRMSLDMLGLGQDDVLILEEQTRGPAGGEYVSDMRTKTQKPLASATSKGTPESGRSSPAPAGPITRGRVKRDGRPRGTVGLVNLGNTCYMNSALQCISRVEELALYFLHSNFKKDINSNNPLGYNGRMAKAYADLLSGLYSPGATSAYRPSPFKSALSSAQPMFSGYGQQDSQEFLSFLVDALHEDLNRIQKKPYIENPDSDDNTVHDPEAIKALGQTYQDNHRLRNDSVAMDLFNGFYKNTMVCPDCDKVSVTFDPYSLLTLQLPVENTWRGQIIFVPCNGKPITYNIDMDKNATWKAVKDFIASKNEGLTRDRILFTEIFGHKIYKVFSDSDTISESGIQQNDILCMYELSEVPTNLSYAPKRRGYQSSYRNSPEPPLPGMDSPLADHFVVPVLHCRGEARAGSPNLVLNPSFVVLTREEAKSYDAILTKLLFAVAGLTSSDFLDEFCNQSRSAEARPAANMDDEAAAADADGRVTDHSNSSEDGYVDVTLSGAVSSIPRTLRDLFDIRYLEAGDEMIRTGTSSLGVTRPVHERVQPRVIRRGSSAVGTSIISETSSDHGSVDTAGSPISSDEDAPALPLSGVQQTFNGDVESEDELSQAVPSTFSKDTRRQKFNNKRSKKKYKQTYSKKGRRSSVQSTRSTASQASTAQPYAESDQCFIRLGEAIVLDWQEGAFDALFAGESSGDDMRGYFTLEPKQIPVAEDAALTERLTRRKKRAQDGITLDDCFAETGKTEVLSEENAWYCNRCKELRRASKTLEIWTAPDILVVHLKRFSGERYRRDKVDVLVDFPMEGLDLTERVGCKEDGKEYLYDLFAVDNHYGGLGGGHYTAYAKNFLDGKWYDFNGKSSNT